MRLLVIRHGQSTWNAAGRWQGQADPPLTPVGELQALQAAAVLAELEHVRTWDAVVASDLQRAAQTASIIADELGHSRVHLDARLRERHAGEWQGLTRAEVDARFPGYLDSGRRPPGFESAESTSARALAALRSVAARHPGGTALVVSHGGIVRALRATLDTDDDRAFPNLSGQWFEIDEHRIVGGELVLLVDQERPSSATPL
jgi:probable phosphoglycerate mutase